MQEFSNLVPWTKTRNFNLGPKVQSKKLVVHLDGIENVPDFTDKLAYLSLIDLVRLDFDLSKFQNFASFFKIWAHGSPDAHQIPTKTFHREATLNDLRSACHLHTRAQTILQLTAATAGYSLSDDESSPAVSDAILSGSAN